MSPRAESVITIIMKNCVKVEFTLLQLRHPVVERHICDCGVDAVDVELRDIRRHRHLVIVKVTHTVLTQRNDDRVTKYQRVYACSFKTC